MADTRDFGNCEYTDSNGRQYPMTRAQQNTYFHSLKNAGDV